MKMIYTVGTWDLLHVGHLEILRQCKALGGKVAVGVASDEVVASYKPHAPVVPLKQRMRMLRALRCVDVVLPYHELDYVSGCMEVDVDVFVVGEDWGNAPHNIAVEEYLKMNGKTIHQVTYFAETSSTKIKERTMQQRGFTFTKQEWIDRIEERRKGRKNGLRKFLGNIAG